MKRTPFTAPLLGLALLAPALLQLPACSSTPSLPAACKVPPESGRCRASIPRWWYDKQMGSCREFIWGGCGGSVPFETMESCHAQCMPGQPPPDAPFTPTEAALPALPATPTAPVAP